MQRLFNFLFVIFALLVISMIGAYMALPEQVMVERRININSQPQQVQQWLLDYRRQQQWLAWKQIDPAIEYEFAGESQGEGAVMHWRAQNESIGSGSQKILSVAQNKKVNIILALSRIGKAYAQFDLDEESGGTTVVWRFEAHFGFNLIARFHGLSLAEDIDEQYRLGLKNLKRVVELDTGNAEKK